MEFVIPAQAGIHPKNKSHWGYQLLFLTGNR
jgi:hypothetical protein